MIARIWHGKTTAANFDAYTIFLQQTAIPDYQDKAGFKGLNFLRQLQKGEGHYTMITFWETLDAIKAFAGEDIEKAKYYPEDNEFLLEFEPTVQHYEVFASIPIT